MKKLSKITESIWSDIQDRSSGDTVRKEDDVNLMSIEDFCDYLNDNYISEDGYRTYRIYYVSKVLSIAVLVDGPANFYSIKYDYGHNMIYLNDEIEDFVPELCQKLKNNFKVVKNRVGASYTKFIIYPSDGSECTNRFFVDVLDFIIENGDKKRVILTKQNLNESIWSDIQDRSAGDTIRKEDDINLMSGEDFCDYLNDNYISKNKYKILYSEHSKCIHIPILNKFIGVLLNLSYDYKDNTITMNYDEVESLCPELCKKIKENFKVDKEYVTIGYTKFIISPSDGSECTNRFFIDVINFIIDNADKNVLLIKKKHINESIWSDIQDRSAGDTIRKEDDINLLDRDGLLDYIYDVYKQIAMHPLPLKSYTSPTCTYFSIPIFKSSNIVYRLNCTFDDNKISKITLMANVAEVKDFKQALIDNFDVTIRDNGSLSITTKDDTVSNQVCMDLIKTIVENAPHPYLKKREN